MIRAAIFSLLTLLPVLGYPVEPVEKTIVTNYVVATAGLEWFLGSECARQIKGRNPDWSRVAAVLALGRPYMNTQELKDFSSGALLKNAQTEVDAMFREELPKMMRRFEGTPKEKCIFLFGYIGGQKEANYNILRTMSAVPVPR